jgi:ATPase subunit of ABC transporter with duplicated ATPase domains
MRVALACSFFVNPDILLLNKLRAYKGALLLVTHDRTLLENYVYSVVLIRDFKLKNFPFSFKHFEQEKEKAYKTKEKTVIDYIKKHRNADPNSFSVCFSLFNVSSTK